MPIPRNLRTATVRQLLDDFADLEARDLVQVLAALRREVGLEILPAIASVLAIQREEWLDHIRAGRAFGFRFNIAAVVGQTGKAQIFNPVGSGVRVLIAAAWSTISVADELFFSRHNVALAAGVKGENLLIGGAVSQADGIFLSAAGAVGTVITGSGLLAANSPFHFARPAEWMAEVPDGQSVLIRHSTSNELMAGGFLWAEVPV